MRRRLIHVLGAFAVVLSLAGCSIDLAGSPGPLARDGKVLKVEFSSVLNLPIGAKVTMRGTTVGTVEKVEVNGADTAVAYCRIDDSVSIPPGTTADLRQTTVLGDIYIGLESPAQTANDRASGSLPDGATIPVSDTTLGPQVEDVMSTLATFINGGSLTALQDALIELQRQLPASAAESRRLSSFLSEQIRGLSVQTAQVNRLLVGAQASTDEILAMRKEFSFLFSDLGRTRIRNLNPALRAAFGLFVQIKALLDATLPLTPLLQIVNPFLEKLFPLIREWSPTPEEWRGNLGDFVRVFGDRMAVFWRKGGSINVKQVTMGGSAPQDRIADVTRLLRMMGAVR